MPVLVLGKRRVEFDAGEFSSEEGIEIEKVTGLPWQEFLETALPGNKNTKIISLKALVWMVRRRNGEPNLTFPEVTFAMGDVDWDLDATQQAAVEKAMAAAAETANPPGGDDETTPPSPPRSGRGRSSKPRPSTGSSPRRNSPASGTTTA